MSATAPSVDAAIAHVEAELGPVDILVNNAGAIGMDHLRRVKPLVAQPARARRSTAA